MPKLPYLYLAFANDPKHPLLNLREEGEQLYQMLLPRKQQGHFDIHRDEFASIKAISQNLRTFKDQVIIFHYGGHAASEALFLYGQEANAEGIAELLGQQKNLKLVFLNGCSTQSQVDYLKSRGVPAVIATSRPINDRLATQFATDFYGALVHNHTLGEAFAHAAASLKSVNNSVSCIRGIVLESELSTDTWILSVADEAHYSWKLPLEVLPEPGGKSKHILTQPSLVPELFLGREDDLLRIHDRLFAPSGNMLLLSGEGGLGKTSLAARYFDRYEKEYAHVAWVTSNRNLVDAVLTLAAPLGLTEDESFLRLDIPTRIEKLLTAMSNLPRPCLLVIDNANELEDLETYYPQLQRCSNFHIIFTTRITEYGTAVFLGVAPLQEDLALNMFRTHYKAFAPTDERHFRELYRAVGGNTLVLEVFAKNLGKLNNKLKIRYSLEELVGDVENGLLELGKAEVVEVRYQSLQKATPEEILGAMYKISDLDPKEASLLAVFAALPPEWIVFDDLETLLRQEDLDALLLLLAQRGWLDYAEEAGAFRCSPVVQAAVRRQHGNWKSDCGNLVRGLVQGLDREIIHEDNFFRSSMYARYAETATAKLDEPDNELGRLCEHLGNFYAYTGDQWKAQKAYRQMEGVFSTLLAGNLKDTSLKIGLAVSYQNLGNIEHSFGKLDQALQFYENFNRLQIELFTAHPENQHIKSLLSTSCSKLGIIHRELGSFEQALVYFKKSNQLSAESVKSNPENREFIQALSFSCQHIGHIHVNYRNFKEALPFFEDQTKWSKELNAAYPENSEYKDGLALSYQNLGLVHLGLENLESARQFFEDSNRIVKELYSENPENPNNKNGLAVSYSNLGEVYLAMDNTDWAMELFEYSNKLLSELYEDFPDNFKYEQSLGTSFRLLGKANFTIGNLQKALMFYKASNHVKKELYKREPINYLLKEELADSYFSLGEVCHALANLEDAAIFFEDSRILLIELNESSINNLYLKYELALLCEKLGQIYLDFLNPGRALYFFEAETNLFIELYESDSDNLEFKQGLAISYQFIGIALSALGDFTSVLMFYEKHTMLFQELYETDPDNNFFKKSLAISYIILAQVYRDHYRDMEKAQGLFEDAQRHLHELVQLTPQNTAFQQNLAWVVGELERLGAP